MSVLTDSTIVKVDHEPLTNCRRCVVVSRIVVNGCASLRMRNAQTEMHNALK